MALLQQWRDMAYDQQADKAKLQQFWAIYFTKEKDIYAELLKNPDELVRGTVKELAEKFGVDIMTCLLYTSYYPVLPGTIFIKARDIRKKWWSVWQRRR